MGRKSTQRERLLMGMIEVANRDGYAGATVSPVATAAGVSKPTFYDHFEDRDDCFVASIVFVQEQLNALVEAAITKGPPQRALVATVETLVSFVSTEREMGRFLTAEAMAGGPAALDARDRGIAEVAALVDTAHEAVAAEAAEPDLESRVLIGGIYRLLAARLRRGEGWISRLSGELVQWISSFEHPSGEHRWRVLNPAPVVPSPSPFVPAEQLHMPNALPPGRPRISGEEVAENHRLRILLAAALLAERKGFNATNVGDITKLAKVASAVFYKQFSDKREAFMAAHEFGYSQVMDVTATAFFSGNEWPERSWEAGRALTQLLEANPLVAHVGFVEAYAVGSAAVQRVEDSHIAFMIFLREGFTYRKQKDNPPSRLALEATVTSIFEILYHQARRTEGPEVAQLLPHIGHLWLTPFLGREESDRLIDRELAAFELPH